MPAWCLSISMRRCDGGAEARRADRPACLDWPWRTLTISSKVFGSNRWMDDKAGPGGHPRVPTGSKLLIGS